jgi:hypothetical protein
MRKILLALCFLLPMPAAAAPQGGPYIGLHGNQSWHITRDAAGRIDDGGASGFDPGLSLTFGLRAEQDPKNDAPAAIFGSFEFFFDSMNETVVQNGAARPMADRPIYKSGFAAGWRLKAGLTFFKRLDIYGHLGLAYWDRDLYLYRKDSWDTLKWLGGLGMIAYGVGGIVQHWTTPIGLGMTFHIYGGWALNANYARFNRFLILGAEKSKSGDPYGYAGDRLRVDIDVVTLGVLYHF